jgi:hypothetical protein
MLDTLVTKNPMTSPAVSAVIHDASVLSVDFTFELIVGGVDAVILSVPTG